MEGNIKIMFFDNITLLEDAIKKNMLPPIDVFDCPYDTSKSYTGIIRVEFPEFTCLCPKTGYPDFASIVLFYLPKDLCIELKSWKLYLNSFRMIGTFHETVTSHLFNTVLDKIDPRWAMINADFSPRGNVSTSLVFETETKRPASLDAMVLPDAEDLGTAFDPEANSQN